MMLVLPVSSKLSTLNLFQQLFVFVSEEENKKFKKYIIEVKLEIGRKVIKCSLSYDYYLHETVLAGDIM